MKEYKVIKCLKLSDASGFSWIRFIRVFADSKEEAKKKTEYNGIFDIPIWISTNKWLLNQVLFYAEEI